MKTITIPKRFGYPTLDIHINGERHTLESGKEISVADEVAEIIENAIALEPKPKRYLSKFAQRADGSLVEITKEDLEAIEIIVDHSFNYCQKLTDVTIPDNVTSLGDGAFYTCSNLEIIRFVGNSKLNSIGKNAFQWCGKLKEVCLPETPPTLANIDAFGNINTGCIFYCKTQESLIAYKAATNWSTLAETYTFTVEP